MVGGQERRIQKVLPSRSGAEVWVELEKTRPFLSSKTSSSFSTELRSSQVQSFRWTKVESEQLYISWAGGSRFSRLRLCLRFVQLYYLQLRFSGYPPREPSLPLQSLFCLPLLLSTLKMLSPLRRPEQEDRCYTSQGHQTRWSRRWALTLFLLPNISPKLTRDHLLQLYYLTEPEKWCRLYHLWFGRQVRFGMRHPSIPTSCQC